MLGYGLPRSGLLQFPVVRVLEQNRQSSPASAQYNVQILPKTLVGSPPTPQAGIPSEGKATARRGSLQRNLPPDLAQKFDRNRREAEAKAQQQKAQIATNPVKQRKASFELGTEDATSLSARVCRSQSLQRRQPIKDIKRSKSAAATRRRDRSARQMYDKRTLRRMSIKPFSAAIQQWRFKHQERGSRPCAASACHVGVRLRPMFEKELQQGEFEVVSVVDQWGEVVVHNCLFHADLVKMYVQHCGFCFPLAFGSEATNEVVYEECGAPLVEQVLAGQLATLFMFGQTGSGKTYTMTSLMELATHAVFKAAGNVRVKVFEVAGKKCFDLLTKQRAELRLLDDANGRTQVVGAEEFDVESAVECFGMLQKSLARRATAGHARNDESSRSHCVITLHLPETDGSLILVDCAGTERRQDTEQHTADRMTETAEINASLHALKECIRYRSKEHRSAAAAAAAKAAGTWDDEDEQKHIHVPYRGSYLTRVLHESFTRRGSYLSAIGAISPTSMDTEHTLSTLKTLQMLVRDTDAPSFEQKADVDPKAVPRRDSMGPQSPLASRSRGSTFSAGAPPRLEMGAKVTSVASAPSSVSAPFGTKTSSASATVKAASLKQESSEVALLSSRIVQLEEALKKKTAELESKNVTLNPNLWQLQCSLEHLEAKSQQLESMNRELQTRSANPAEEMLVRLQQTEANSRELEAKVRETEARAREAEARAREAEVKLHGVETLLQQEQARRRKCHNQLVDMKGQMRVFCRIRPMLMPREQGHQVCTIWKDMFTVEVLQESFSVDGTQHYEKKAFQFDTVFGPEAGQQEVFSEVENLVQSALDGYNVTIIAYGQTGAGKTHTMYGGAAETRGVAPRTVEAIFSKLSQLDSGRFTSRVSANLVELYKDSFVDLLATGRGIIIGLDVKCDVLKGNAWVEGAEERTVQHPEQLLQLIDEGVSRRNVAATQMNSESSRSHLFLTISIEVGDRDAQSAIVGKIRLCDLAGSERLKKSGAIGDTMRETIEINKSLTALADVTEALTRDGRRGLVPYRNHKLTQLLSDSLGGTAKTLMFVNLAPAQSEVDETLCSLQYATRASGITNDVRKACEGPRSGNVRAAATSASQGSAKSGKAHLRRRNSFILEDLHDHILLNMQA